MLPAVCLLAGFWAVAEDPKTAETEALMRPPRSSAETRKSLSLTVGKSVLVHSTLPMQRVAVGLGGYAEATAVSPREIMLNGKAPGETSLIIWQEDGSKLLFDIEVQPSRFLAKSRIELIARQLKAELPGQQIDLSVEDDTIFLRGRVKDVTSADRAFAIASTQGKALNLLYVDVPIPEAQILLKVKFASVDRNLSSQLGVNLFSTGAVNTVGSVTTEQFVPPLIPSVQTGTKATTASLSDALNLFLFRPDLNLGATLKALEMRGLLEVLAEPNVLAQNGRPASFLAGGEFPFPVVQGSTGGGAAAVTIQFREFGVRLNFIPTVTPRGSIQLRVAPEVSALDFTHGLTVNGFAVPALTVRKLSTAVELSEGQSFAIAGLLDNRVTDTFEKIPFISSLPILGRFFQSRNRNKENTELLVIVTPELVRPIPQGQPTPGLKFPAPFLEPNTGGEIRTPGTDVTGPAAPPSGEPVPIEVLLKSLQLESASEQQQPLTIAPVPLPANSTTPPALPAKK